MTQPHVLLVEDNRELVANLTEVLLARGYAVRSAATVDEALSRAQDWVDVALVDLKLPDGHGTELAVQLKDRAPDCEVVMLTGFASVESAAAAVRAGAWAYLVKPCATAELLLTVEQALRHVRTQAEKRELARRAQVAEKLAAVGTLTAGLSHEIRNPLNGASLQLAVLERRVKKLEGGLQPPLLEPLMLVRDEIRRLDHILEDFLQFARPAPFTPHPVPLFPVLQRVATLLAADAERRGLKLQLDCPEDSMVRGDEGQLRQVFMNLCLNALDATPSGGLVEISCSALDGQLVVHVDDAGPGITDDARQRIFEPFFTTKASSSGLGLPISNAIITRHGGAIAVGASPSGGARISVVLPRA
jgi:two-component system sensor histidine kinase HydH